MKDGKLPDGAAVLGAREDRHMASPNINLRDPAIYRINSTPSTTTPAMRGIYPMYTFAHPWSRTRSSASI